jgi:signal transduction histidine kinase
MDIPEFKGFLYTSTVDEIIERKGTPVICFGSYDKGLWLFNQKTGETKVINSTISRLGDDCIRSLDEDGQGNLWIGTRNGAFILDKKDSLYSLSRWLGLDQKTTDYKILDIGMDSAGNAWMATNYDGIIKVDRKQKKITSYKVDGNPEVKSFNSILVDSNGMIWAGSMWNGLYMYDSKRDEFRKADEFVFMENKAINNLAEGPNGRIWVTTNNQVVAFQYVNGSFERIWYQNISGNSESVFFNRNTSLYLPEFDSMAFGCSHGILFFPCNPARNDKTKYSIAITDFKAGERSFDAANYTKRITLKHSENDIDIWFSLLDFNDPDGDIYRYRLTKSGKKVYESEWMIVNGDRNEASFHNLGPGRYVFEVCGARSGGFIVSRYKQLEIRVLQNPWISWWAIIGYTLIFLTLVYFGLRNVRTRLALKRKVEFEQMNAQKTEEVDQAKLRFFTNVSHEFLTPLSIIMAAIESLQPKTESDKKISNIISVNAIRLTRLVQQVLEFRKVESDNLKLKVSHNDAAEFIGHCVEAFLPLVRKHNLSISFDADPQKIEGWYDPDKLDKIMYNLISNAVKYTPEGGSVKVSVSSPEKDVLRISCSNDGDLMNQKTVGRLFKRFYEGDYRKFNTIGTGIGLSLVKSLVDKHKGKIEVVSNESVGNCFTVTLPIGRGSYSASEIDHDIVPNIPLAFSMGENIIKD